MTLDPRLLRTFVVLADELHFGRAAARLHIAQPALSQQVKRLEAQVGVELFARTRRSVELTGAGAAMLAPARTAVEAAASAEEVARSHADGYSGEVRLGLSPGVHYLAQALLDEFARARPGVRLRARQDSTGALARQVAAGELELAVGCCAEPLAGLAVETLSEEPVVVAVAERHALARRTPVTLADLRDECLALVDAADGPGYNRAVVELCRAAGFEPRTPPDPHGPMAWETAVRSGGCVGLTTRSAAASTARGLRLLALEPAAALPAQLLHAATPESAMRPAAKAFAALARERAAADGPGPSR
jgi:DNA-binding transcriptional LysR family regulator